MALIPRGVIGKYPSGVFGLKTSLPGYNALTDDDTDPNKFSFNSQWTDLVRTHVVGLFAAPANSSGGILGFPVPYPALGYVPFVDAKPIRDGVIRSDWTLQRNTVYTSSIYTQTYTGVPFKIDNGTLYIQVSDLNTSILYSIYKLPAF